MRLLFSTVAVASFGGAKVTPTQKVVQLLHDMAEKGKSEKHEETVQFATYKQFCEDTAGRKQRAIEAGNKRADSLRAAIAKNEADAKRLGTEIGAHDEDIRVWEGDKQAAHRVRDIENTDFQNVDKDYTESLDALENAITVLSKQNYDRSQKEKKSKKEVVEELMQISALIPAESRRVLDAFLAKEPDNSDAHLAVKAPEAHGYEFQSQGVIDLLTKLRTKFDGEREKARKEEADSKQAFALLVQSLTNQVDEATRQRNDKAEDRATKQQKKGDNTADLNDTVATRDDDQKYLSDLTATCEKKAADFEKRQQLRADEIVAIEKAVEILSSESVAGAAKKHLPTLTQTAFLQLRNTRQTSAQERVARYLTTQGDRIHSRVLAALAVRVADDPFRKVKKMIKDLIVRLMEEATQETEKKAWCDTELTNNEHTRNEKTNKVEHLHALVDQLHTSVAKLSEDIAQLTQEVADLDKAVADAIDLRAKEKAKNKSTIKDAQEAQEAVARALAVLQEFYARASEATSLVQDDAPEIFDSPYKGQQAESGGVVSMLDVIQSDFARLEAETTSDEEQSQKEHREFLNDSEVDKTQKTKDIEHKTASKEDQQQLLVESEEDLVGTQKELDAANAYFDQLKPQCIQSGASYEERAARRQEEIESLQEALRILNSEDLA